MTFVLFSHLPPKITLFFLFIIYCRVLTHFQLYTIPDPLPGPYHKPGPRGGVPSDPPLIDPDYSTVITSLYVFDQTFQLKITENA